MERATHCPRRSHGIKVALPRIPRESCNSHNKENLMSSSCSTRMQDLKKLCFQNKSNSRLLRMSPYASPKNCKKLIEMAKRKWCQPLSVNSRTNYFDRLKISERMENPIKKLFQVSLLFNDKKNVYWLEVESTAEIVQRLLS